MYDTTEKISDASVSKEREDLLASRRRLRRQTNFLLKAGWVATAVSIVLFLLSLHLHKNLWLLWAIVGPSVLVGIVATFYVSERDWTIRCALDELRLQCSPGSIELIEEFCQMSSEARRMRDDIRASGRGIYAFDFDEMLEAAARVLAETSPAAKATRENKFNKRLGMCVLVFSRMKEAHQEELAARTSRLKTGATL